MRNTITLLLVLAVVGLFCLPNESLGVGLGIQIPTIGSGTSTVTIGGDEYPNDIDNSHFGFGFVLDTKVANPGVFNYRLHISYESFELGSSNFQEDSDLQDNLSRYSIDNTFGFAVLQSRVVRLWLGPQLRISYMHYSKDYVDLNLIGIGFAPVLGANFNMGDVFTLSPELGYRISVYGGTISYDTSYFSDSEDWSMTNREFFIKLNIIFRINDYHF